MKDRGFTLIELIMVIAILGILAVAALPRILDLVSSADEASRDSVVGSIRSSIALYYGNDVAEAGSTASYPTSLDSVAAGTDCSPTNPCFTLILIQGVNDSKWHKVNDTQYSFNDGSAVTTFNYNTTDGTFSP